MNFPILLKTNLYTFNIFNLVEFIFYTYLIFIKVIFKNINFPYKSLITHIFYIIYYIIVVLIEMI